MIKLNKIGTTTTVISTSSNLEYEVEVFLDGSFGDVFLIDEGEASDRAEHAVNYEVTFCMSEVNDGFVSSVKQWWEEKTIEVIVEEDEDDDGVLIMRGRFPNGVTSDWMEDTCDLINECMAIENTPILLVHE